MNIFMAPADSFWLGAGAAGETGVVDTGGGEVSGEKAFESTLGACKMNY